MKTYTKNTHSPSSIWSLLSCFLLYCVCICRICLIMLWCRQRKIDATNVRIRHLNKNKSECSPHTHTHTQIGAVQLLLSIFSPGIKSNEREKQVYISPNWSHTRIIVRCNLQKQQKASDSQRARARKWMRRAKKPLNNGIEQKEIEAPLLNAWMVCKPCHAMVYVWVSVPVCVYPFRFSFGFVIPPTNDVALALSQFDNVNISKVVHSEPTIAFCNAFAKIPCNIHGLALARQALNT